jgi:transposase
MAKRIHLRAMSEEEQRVLARLSASRKAASGLVKRATMVVRYYAGHSCRQIGRDLHVDEETVSRWVHRFVDGGLDGLRDEARSGRPAMYTVDEVSLLIQTALTSPQELGLPFGSWTLDRLQAYLQEELAQARMVVWRASRSGLRAKKGAIVELYQRPPTESIVVCLDQ